MFALAHFAKGKNISGKITFYQPEKYSKTLIIIKLSGVEPGKHGLHIHNWGDESNGCQSMGSHFDVGKHNHGPRNGFDRHTGDFGNVFANEHGVIEESFVMPVNLSGKNTIVGRGIVLHKYEDDLGRGKNEESLKTGNAGPRIACAPIVYCSLMSI